MIFDSISVSFSIKKMENTESPIAAASREEELSVQLLEEKQKTFEMGEKVAALNRQLAQITKEKLQLEESHAKFRDDLVEKTNFQLLKSNEEVGGLRDEIEQLSAALFTEANLQVETAKKSQWDIKQLNDKLADTLQTKDNTIEVMQAELAQFKAIITDLQSQIDSPTSSSGAVTATANEMPPETLFDIPSLDKYNSTPISIHTFNQLRLDSPFALSFKESLTTNFPDTWSIRSTKVFETIMCEIESCVRLDKSPALRYKFNKRSLLMNLLDYKAGIEPLSASTEAWKRYQLDSSVSASTSTTIKTPQPLATHDPCSLCGEKRDHINYSRLYKMSIFKKEKEVHSLCITCASKWRVVIPLMNCINNLKPITDYTPVNMQSGEMFIPGLVDLYDQYYQIIPYMISLTYLRLGVWEEGDVCGLVYGWRNKWLGKFIPKNEPETPAESPKGEQTEVEGESEVKKEAPEELVIPKRSEKSGVDLRVVSITKRLSVNLLAGNQVEQEDKEDSEEFVDAEKSLEGESDSGDSNEDSNEDETPSID